MALQWQPYPPQSCYYWKALQHHQEIRTSSRITSNSIRQVDKTRRVQCVCLHWKWVDSIWMEMFFPLSETTTRCNGRGMDCCRIAGWRCRNGAESTIRTLLHYNWRLSLPQWSHTRTPVVV